MIATMGREASYAARVFDVEVHLLILDSCEGSAYSTNTHAVDTLREVTHDSRVVVHHLDEAQQREFFERALARAGLRNSSEVLRLMLPSGVSYGACINRAFIIAAALGCESVHHRDSDCEYQVADEAELFPIQHELASLGQPAASVLQNMTEVTLSKTHGVLPVAVVGGSFVGERSVDIADIDAADPEAYFDVVSLWASPRSSDSEKRALVEESFKGARNATFQMDSAKLALLDPMRMDMCNSGIHRVYEWVPLCPATETIGSDYFLLHVIKHAGLPSVVHNRHILNYYTRERKTDSGFLAYQARFVKFLLSMLYLHDVYDRMEEAGSSMLDRDGRVRAKCISEFISASTRLDRSPNLEKLDQIDTTYRKLGGRYTVFAESLVPRRAQLLDEARSDMMDFATLVDAWGPFMEAAKSTPVYLFPESVA